jgi:hypothetical protein
VRLVVSLARADRFVEVDLTVLTRALTHTHVSVGE